MKLFYQYELKDQGFPKEYLGVQVNVNVNSLPIDQSKYAKEIHRKCCYENTHAVGNYWETNVHLRSAADEVKWTPHLATVEQQVCLCIGYLQRPISAYSLWQLSRVVSALKKQHKPCEKRAYQIGTTNPESKINFIVCMVWRSIHEHRGKWYCDSDWASDLDNRRSTGGFAFTRACGAVA